MKHVFSMFIIRNAIYLFLSYFLPLRIGGPVSRQSPKKSRNLKSSYYDAFITYAYELKLVKVQFNLSFLWYFSSIQKYSEIDCNRGSNNHRPICIHEHCLHDCAWKEWNDQFSCSRIDFWWKNFGFIFFSHSTRSSVVYFWLCPFDTIWSHKVNLIFLLN